ncbi:MAG: L,D-transpeptidase [Pseudolabrys sp.]|nr:L,D-transpeptidase [Pseudolabrys sp.]
MTLLRPLAALLLLIAIPFAASPADARGDLVAFRSGYRAGTIVVATGQRQLFFVVDGERAIRYPVGVGRAGMAWHGTAYVAAKHVRPAWARIPGRTPTYPGGSPNNPMGAAAMGLDRGNYAIHGTNDPSSIGGFVSHGCIRMYNDDIMDLYRRTPLGTQVHVLQ